MGGRLDHVEAWKASKQGGRHGKEGTVFDNVTGVVWTGFSEGRAVARETQRLWSWMATEASN